MFSVDTETQGLNQAVDSISKFTDRITRLQAFWADMEAKVNAIQDESRRTQLLDVVHRHQARLQDILNRLTQIKNAILQRINEKLHATAAGFGAFGDLPTGWPTDMNLFNDPLRQEETEAINFSNTNQIASAVPLAAPAADMGMMGWVIVGAAAFFAFAALKRS